jgi:hypothetical protein
MQGAISSAIGEPGSPKYPTLLPTNLAQSLHSVFCHNHAFHCKFSKETFNAFRSLSFDRSLKMVSPWSTNPSETVSASLKS